MEGGGGRIVLVNFTTDVHSVLNPSTLDTLFAHLHLKNFPDF